MCRPVLHRFAQKTYVHIGFSWNLFKSWYPKSGDCANLKRHIRIVQISPDTSNLYTGFVQKWLTKVGFRCSNRVSGVFFSSNFQNTLWWFASAVGCFTACSCVKKCIGVLSTCTTTQLGISTSMPGERHQKRPSRFFSESQNVELSFFSLSVANASTLGSYLQVP